MVVAVVAVGMVQVAVDQVIHVIAVGHRGVAASGSVNMAPRVAAARMSRRASVRIGGVHGDDMLVDVSLVGMVQVPVVKVVDVVAVPDRRVTASGAVRVGMVAVDLAGIRVHGFRGPTGSEVRKSNDRPTAGGNSIARPTSRLKHPPGPHNSFASRSERK